MKEGGRKRNKDTQGETRSESVREREVEERERRDSDRERRAGASGTQVSTFITNM